MFVIFNLQWHRVGQKRQKCKETSNMMWLSLIWFISFMFVCWNLFCIIANLRIKCVTETNNVSVLFYKNLKSSFLHDSHIWHEVSLHYWLLWLTVWREACFSIFSCHQKFLFTYFFLISEAMQVSRDWILKTISWYFLCLPILFHFHLANVRVFLTQWVFLF